MEFRFVLNLSEKVLLQSKFGFDEEDAEKKSVCAPWLILGILLLLLYQFRQTFVLLVAIAQISMNCTAENTE